MDLEPMGKPTTEAEALRRDIVTAIDNFWMVRKTGPSLMDLTRITGKSKTDIHYHLEILKSRGDVVWEEEYVRNIRTKNLIIRIRRYDDDMEM